ncbi:OLC1v1003280C1 [Oldenlandia corymbosa var. corymbosa]|uniref:OLC1v1003280C1 n=1 Tax=Oldenlandia corymbosa var. corymbosa TaxID=529605 RepID=A0AAV1DD14_OLDCO|nr:OLC1v1003280C1 [Oldenlandia corymbosa var. corymbosa]
MADFSVIRRCVSRSSPLFAVFRLKESRTSNSFQLRCPYGSSAAVEEEEEDFGSYKIDKKENKWFTLPPFTPTVDGAVLGKAISRSHMSGREKGPSAVSTVTALKWVIRCCPELPRSLVQKLFRLRRVRRDSRNGEVQERQLKRVSAKDMLNSGDTLYLPVTVGKNVPSAKADDTCDEEEMKFLRNLILYKDQSIIVVNKPHGMPVQGGIGINRGLDELAAKYLRFNNSESPRLVHRLDRDCSGILVMGRSKLSTAALHSIFREKTLEAAEHDPDCRSQIIQKTYWALVVGSPRYPKGLISKPLGKVLIDNGRSDRITVFENIQSSSAQNAVTEYKVIGSSCHGFTWVELSPLTGRKHQLRVHCAEVLGTPIVGDYKYGWQAHKNLKHLSSSTLIKELYRELPKEKLDPFGLDFRDGSISDKQPRLHLHCKEMILPDISPVMQRVESSITDSDLKELRSIKLKAPLPLHMQMSWDLMNSDFQF